MVRLKISRPNLSVPRGCSTEYETRSASRFCLNGSCGARSGAKSAASANNVSMAMPAESQSLPDISNSRVDELVQNIGQKIYQHVGRCDDQNTALYQRVVARVNRLDGQAADARPTKDRLRDQRPGQKSAELQAHDGHDRKQRVAQHVFQPNLLFTQTFCTRR